MQLNVRCLVVMFPFVPFLFKTTDFLLVGLFCDLLKKTKNRSNNNHPY